MAHSPTLHRSSGRPQSQCYRYVTAKRYPSRKGKISVTSVKKLLWISTIPWPTRRDHVKLLKDILLVAIPILEECPIECKIRCIITTKIDGGGFKFDFVCLFSLDAIDDMVLLRLDPNRVLTGRYLMRNIVDFNSNVTSEDLKVFTLKPMEMNWWFSTFFSQFLVDSKTQSHNPVEFESMIWKRIGEIECYGTSKSKIVRRPQP